MTKTDNQRSVKERDRAGYAGSSSLGQSSNYKGSYDPQLLHAISRAGYRSTIDDFSLATHGNDTWQCFELSWLNTHGLPQVACATITVDLTTDYIVESKSLKLYLNSFRNHQSFHEACTVGIGKQLVNLLAPRWLRIGGYWYPRGGMPIDVFWQFGEVPAGTWLPDQGVAGYRGRG